MVINNDRHLSIGENDQLTYEYELGSGELKAPSFSLILPELWKLREPTRGLSSANIRPHGRSTGRIHTSILRQIIR